MFLIRIILNLFGVASRLLILPIFLLKRHAFALIILAAIIYVVVQFSTDDTPAPSHSAYTTLPATGAVDANGAQIIAAPVTAYEDGNSMFAKDLLKAMTEEQAVFYSRMFYAVLSQVQDGTAYPWQQGNIAGRITPTETFKNGRGSTCRKFDEILKVGSVQQTITGQACARPDGSWCKLKLSSTAACGLHTKPGMFDGLKDISIF